MRHKGNIILNGPLIAAITDLKHGETLTIADAGLPYSTFSDVIDLSLRPGLPRFTDVLRAITEELVVEQITYAEETDENPRVDRAVKAALHELASKVGETNTHTTSHEEFKAQVTESRFVVRTAEVTPYANVILHAGVSF